MVRRLRLLLALVVVVPAAAFAQSGLIRSGTNATTGAIQNEIREAVRPRLQITNSAGAITGLALSGDGSVLAIAPSDRSLRMWDLQNGLQVARLDALGATAFAVANDGSLLASAGADGVVHLWDWRGARPSGVAAGNFPVAALALAPDKRGIAAGTRDGRLIAWPNAQAAPVVVTTASSGIAAVAFDRGGQIVAAGNDGAVYAWDGKSPVRATAAIGPVAAIGIGADGQIAAASDTRDHLKILDLRNGSVLRDVAVAAGSAHYVTVDSVHRRVITGGDDGIVRVRNLDTGELLVQIISTLSGWTAVDAQGRFDGTVTGVADVKWLASQLNLPIDNFSQAYFEPQLVARYMRPQAAFVAPAPKPVFGGIDLPPRVTVTTQSGAAGVDVTVAAQDQGGGVGAISLFQNGKLVPSQRQTGERKDAPGGVATTIRTYRVPLASGSNAFEAVAASASGVEGEHAKTDVAGAAPANGATATGAPAAGAPAGGATGALPTAHILTVGINKYRDSRFDLDFGVSDAVAIAQSLEKSQGIFGKVIGQKLTDAAATRANIVKAMTELQRAPANDVLVIYLAGHGQIVDDEWYFLPHDFVFSPEGVKRTGISAATWRDLISRVGPQRVLMLVDSCKSGGSVDTLATAIDRKVLRALGRDSGVAILAGARRDQTAEEFPQLRHGAFTYVVLQGIGGKADERHDSRITTDELLTYSSSELPLLTKRLINQTQVPVSYSRGAGFPIHHTGP